MLERHWCDSCGYEFSREYEAGSFRWTCATCGHGYVIIAGSEPPDKTLAVFRTAIDRLRNQDAEGAADGAAQFHELWLKSIVRAREPQWFHDHRFANVGALLQRVEHSYKLPLGCLRRLDRLPRNLAAHDLKYTVTTEEAEKYVRKVLAAMRATLMALLGGRDVWRRGEAGELNHLDSRCSEQYRVDFQKYHDHYRLGIVGPVMWSRTLWLAYRKGRIDWYKARWTRQTSVEAITPKTLFPFSGT